MKEIFRVTLFCVLFAFVFSLKSGAQIVESSPLFTSAILPMANGDFVLINKGAKSASVYSADFKTIKKTWDFSIAPTGGVISGKTLLVTAFDKASKLYIVNTQTDEIRTIPIVGQGATTAVMSPDAKVVYVLNQFSNTIAEIDVTSGVVKRNLMVLREPKGAVITPDGRYMFVTNFLPAQRADVDYVAADVSVVDLADFKIVKNLKLANGSNALRGITISSDGKYVLVSHNLGRFQVPTSQLQQGWMNTSAMSVIDVATQSYVGAILLDEPDRGAAGIWDIQTTPEYIVVSHSGTHDVSVIDYPKFVEKLTSYKGDVETLAYDLRFLYGLRERVKLEGNGPRNFAIVNDKAYIPTYFADVMNVMALSDKSVTPVVLNPRRKETDAQQGERIFNDATFCFQNWQSCNGCHPGDVRTDGMNWDLMNDGIGNSKNCKSLLYSIQTPPSMISGIRATGELANRKGFTHIQFSEISEEKAKMVDEYIKSLEAVPSPYLVDGELSEKAQRGRKVFEKLGCQECHSGPYYTDLKMYRIGEDIEFDAGWDTPTLREVWRTAPYLFNGRAATMRDVFAVYRHGIDKKISNKELDELVEYVNSL